MCPMLCTYHNIDNINIIVDVLHNKHNLPVVTDTLFGIHVSVSWFLLTNDRHTLCII